MATWDTLRSKLARQLRELFEQSEHNETSAAAAVGFSQSKVSRMLSDTVKTVPSPEDVATLARVLGATPPTADLLRGLAQQVADEKAGFIPSRVILDRGSVNHQRRIKRMEERSHRIATYHPQLVPAVLQTERYLRAIAHAGAPIGVAPAEVDKWLVERLARQRILADPAREITVVVPETALWWALLDADGMAEQVEHIAAAIPKHPNWRIGVIPRGVPPGPRPIYMSNGFDLHDSREVVIGTTVGTAIVTDADEVAKHEDYLTRLSALAAFGDAAVPVLERSADEYRFHA